MKTKNCFKLLLLVVMALVMTTVFTACGEENNEGEYNFTYGLSIWGNSDAHGYGVDKGCSWLQQIGGTYIQDFGAMDPDAQIASCEKLINAGCDFITFCAYTGEAIIPSIANLCRQNEVYFSIWDTTVTDAEIQKQLDSNPYFCGTTNEDGYDAGYKQVQLLAQQGATDFVFIKYGDGIETCEDRLKGATKAVEDLNLTNAYTMTAPQDVKKAVQDVLTNNTKANAIISLGSCLSYLPGSFEAIKAAGREGSVYTSGFDFYDNMPADLEAGRASVVAGGHICTGYYAALMCLSKYLNKPLNPDREQLKIQYLYCSSKQDYTDYQTYVVGETPIYSADDIKTMLELPSFAKLQEVANKWTIENAKAGTMI